jgi:hypothetical protein
MQQFLSQIKLPFMMQLAIINNAHIREKTAQCIFFYCKQIEISWHIFMRLGWREVERPGKALRRMFFDGLQLSKEMFTVTWSRISSENTCQKSDLATVIFGYNRIRPQSSTKLSDYSSRHCSFQANFFPGFFVSHLKTTTNSKKTLLPMQLFRNSKTGI